MGGSPQQLSLVQNPNPNPNPSNPRFSPILSKPWHSPQNLRPSFISTSSKRPFTLSSAPRCCVRPRPDHILYRISDPKVGIPLTTLMPSGPFLWRSGTSRWGGREFAAGGGGDIEFSPEDSGRLDRDFRYHALVEVINAGATTVNIPDTVGYTLPEFGKLIADIKVNTSNVENLIISTHCQNDLGLSTANTLALDILISVLMLGQDKSRSLSMVVGIELGMLPSRGFFYYWLSHLGF